MLRLPGPAAPLAATERHALELLVDLARIVPVDDPEADVVRVEVSDAPRDPGSLASAKKAGEDIDDIIKNFISHPGVEEIIFKYILFLYGKGENYAVFQHPDHTISEFPRRHEPLPCPGE